MATTYPAPPAAVTQGGNAIEVHRFLKQPNLVARRIRDISLQRYIADALLTGRFDAVGGSILYEDGAPLFDNDNPEAVAPGGEYPTTAAEAGKLYSAIVAKWGRDKIVTDEAIARLTMSPVERAFQTLVNTNVRFIDSIALAAITSKVTQTHAASGAWSGADAGARIIEDVLTAKAEVDELNEGYDLNTVVLRPVQYAQAMARMLATGVLPRESANPVNSGTFPSYLGVTWLSSTNLPGTDPLMVDTTQLGGMADEKLGGPGYTTAGNGIETKVIRDDAEDRYRLRARRVTVPVVLEPRAAITITGTGI